MRALIRFDGETKFEKNVYFETLPDVDDAVRVLKTDGSEGPYKILKGIVTARTFSEMCWNSLDPERRWAAEVANMGVIIDVQQA